MLASLLTVVVLVTAQAPTDPAAAPVVEPPAAPVAEAPPSAAPAASTSPPATAPAPDAKPAGMDVVPTAAAQCGAGVVGCCVGACVAAPCAFIPIVGQVAQPLIVGTAIGASEAVVGDALGTRRSALLWPVLSSVGVMTVGTVVNVGAAIVLGIGLSALDPGQLAAGALPTSYLALGAISLGTLVLAGVVPVVVYHLTGVDKEPGDAGGFGMPGIVAPADPTGTRAAKAASSSSNAPPPASSSPTATPNVGY
jgi:hypothetical protein